VTPTIKAKAAKLATNQPKFILNICVNPKKEMCHFKKTEKPINQSASAIPSTQFRKPLVGARDTDYLP
jgi:hypothetical protein